MPSSLQASQGCFCCWRKRRKRRRRKRTRTRTRHNDDDAHGRSKKIAGIQLFHTDDDGLGCLLSRIIQLGRQYSFLLCWQQAFFASNFDIGSTTLHVHNFQKTDSSTLHVHNFQKIDSSTILCTDCDNGSILVLESLTRGWQHIGRLISFAHSYTWRGKLYWSHGLEELKQASEPQACVHYCIFSRQSPNFCGRLHF